MPEKISALAAILSVLISIIALIIAKSSAANSAKIAAEALKTARQSNDIALGLIKEYPVLEIYSFEEVYDFTNSKSLKVELENRLSLKNSGEVGIDAISIEIIGIEPLTYAEIDLSKPIRPLPASKTNVALDSVILPTGLAHIDISLPILKYLEKLKPVLIDDDLIYKTTINVVLSPKAVGATLPTGVVSESSTKDRALLSVRFDPRVTDTIEARKILKADTIPHRVYSP